MFRELAVLQADDIDEPDVDGFAGRRRTVEFARVGAGHADARDHLIALGHHVFNLNLQVRKALDKLVRNPLKFASAGTGSFCPGITS